MGDYISREDAIIALWKLSDRYYKMIVSPTVLAEKAFKAIPSADVESVRHGRWIQISEMNLDRNVLYECSECHFSDTHAVGVDVPYCWNCGARMDGEQDE